MIVKVYGLRGVIDARDLRQPIIQLLLSIKEFNCNDERGVTVLFPQDYLWTDNRVIIEVLGFSEKPKVLKKIANVLTKMVCTQMNKSGAHVLVETIVFPLNIRVCGYAIARA